LRTRDEESKRKMKGEKMKHDEKEKIKKDDD
jgi:hypothetical protein